jgi:hypothetical protein
MNCLWFKPLACMTFTSFTSVAVTASLFKTVLLMNSAMENKLFNYDVYRINIVICLGDWGRRSDCWLVLFQYTFKIAVIITQNLQFTSLIRLLTLVPLLICSERLAFTWKLPTTNCLGRPSCLQENPSARTTEKTHLFHIRIIVRGNVFIEPLPSYKRYSILLLFRKA